jgi:DNA-binding transcriptional LysR family regulator
MELTLVGLRVLREVAERGSFTAAAAALGYTQSAVSRQVAALERSVGRALFDRRPDGVRLTSAGLTLLGHAGTALDAVEAARRELTGLAAPGGVVRLGMYISAGVVVVPRALVALRKARPDITVTTRESTTPALVRALRAGSIDLAVISSRPPFLPPDGEAPRLHMETLAENSLLLAVPADDPLAARSTVTIEDLADRTWVSSPSARGEPLLGVWPGLPGRARVGHAARDWLTKLSLVAAGCGITTVPSSLATAVPAGVRLLTVQDSPHERRRIVLARVPGAVPPAVEEVARALHRAASGLLAP